MFQPGKNTVSYIIYKTLCQYYVLPTLQNRSKEKNIHPKNDVQVSLMPLLCLLLQIDKNSYLDKNKR